MVRCCVMGGVVVTFLCLCAMLCYVFVVCDCLSDVVRLLFVCSLCL